MTCREFIEFLWRYIEEDLPPAEQQTFEDHLAKCSHCVKYLQSYRDTIQAGKVAVADGDTPIPSDVPEDLVQAILRSRTSMA